MANALGDLVGVGVGGFVQNGVFVKNSDIRIRPYLNSSLAFESWCNILQSPCGQQGHPGQGIGQIE